jgi:hypothetical protein
MEARRLIESAAYEPETLSLLYEALDSAWAEIAPRIAEENHTYARVRLAHAVLVVARKDSTDPGKIKRDALQIMALSDPKT